MVPERHHPVHASTQPQLMRVTGARAVTLLCVVSALSVGYGLGGTGVAVAVGILSLPALAWAYDNATGTFLVLTSLFVLTVGIMVLLIALMALAR
ncbi:hypothetical protein QP178_18740 [Sphingomonas aurantiaca]|uniref:hypothetical protein n=1 Tax=Sphingomonas TaxID=13687 RepID=UPI0012E264B2|nr:hypothetical protein [Sphingomonas sp. Leaf28]